MLLQWALNPPSHQSFKTCVINVAYSVYAIAPNGFFLAGHVNVSSTKQYTVSG